MLLNLLLDFLNLGFLRLKPTREHQYQRQDERIVLGYSLDLQVPLSSKSRPSSFTKLILKFARTTFQLYVRRVGSFRFFSHFL